eukprot:g5232.t1
MDRAVSVLAEAVRLDNAGKMAEAIEGYTKGIELLMGPLQRETDQKKKNAMKHRIGSYLSRAETLKKQLALSRRRRGGAAASFPVAPGSSLAATEAGGGKTTTARNYFRPDSAFRRDVAEAKRTRLKIEKICEAKGTTFVDSTFPPNARSIVGKWASKPNARRLAGRVTQWLRPSKMRSPSHGSVPKESEWAVFRGDPRASDVNQGELGDCWFLSSLAVLAAYPELIRRLLVTTGKSRHGVYAVRLCLGGGWKTLLVDDYFPCDSYGFAVFQQPQRQALWVALIEKAFAKSFGSYAAIDGGQTAEALACLTGLPVMTVDDIHKRERITSQKLMQVLLGWHKLGYICTASCGHTHRTDPSEYKKFGLQSAHAYTILGAVTLRGGSLNLIKLRNPWGSGEWRGRWSAKSSLWKSSPDARAVCRPDGCASDGVFWMEMNDLREFFSSVTVCKLRRNWHQIRWPIELPAHIESPKVLAYQLQLGSSAVHTEVCVFQESERGKFPEGKYYRADLMCFIMALPASANGGGATSLDVSKMELIADGANPHSLSVMSCAEAVLKAQKRYIFWR